MTGKIIKLLSGVYWVETPEGIYKCIAKGSFRKKGISPVPGDIVNISVQLDNTGRIEEILPRRNYLIRPNVANVDVICYISSYSKPTPFQFTIDKMLVIAQFNNIKPILVFNKIDMDDEDHVEELAKLYQDLGYPVYFVSAETGIGIEELREALRGKIVVFAGNTGVGKSSIINRLFPKLELKTGEISDKLGRGRHTTRHIELYPVNDGFFADTPGFGALELEGYSVNAKDLDSYFVEFIQFKDDCAYQDCAHINEKNCAILDAVKAGKISSKRYESYAQIYNFLKEKETPWNKKKNS